MSVKLQQVQRNSRLRNHFGRRVTSFKIGGTGTFDV